MPVVGTRYQNVTISTKTEVTVYELREFTRTDWFGYQGCIAEKSEPVTFNLEFSNKSVAIFVADDTGICLDYIPEDFDFSHNMEVLSLELVYAANRLVIKGIWQTFHDHAENYTTWEEVKAYILSLGFDIV